MASAYLSRTIGTPTNAKKWTISFWVKIAKTPANSYDLIHSGASGSDEILLHRYESNGTISSKEDDTTGGGTTWGLYGDRKFRDFNGWQHWVHAFDSTQSTAADRYKVYINGVNRRNNNETFATDQTVPLNFESNINTSGQTLNIGKRTFDTANYFNGQLAHVHFIDGIQYDASTFGETDSSTGIWKPKTAPSVTYGNNGFFLKFDNSANMGLDSSGQGNNLTVNGTILQSKDTPTNIYPVLNPADNADGTSFGIQNFGTTLGDLGGSGDYGLRYTLAANSGKWYAEFKFNYSGDGGNIISIADMETRLQINMGSSSPRAGHWGIQRYNDSKTNLYNNGSFISQNTAMWGGFTSSDVISIALDIGAGKIFFGKNGVFKDSSGNTGDPVNGTYPTFSGLTTDGSKYYGFFTENRANIANGTHSNFGLGFFGTTAVSSAGSNGNGSVFEYDVPSGYYALNTENLGVQS